MTFATISTPLKPSPRLLAALSAAALLAYACGPRPPAKESQPAARRARPTLGNELASTVQVAVGATVELALTLANNSPKQLEISFPSGKTHDFVVSDTLGRELWRWSSGRLFTQAMQNKVIARDDTLKYLSQWTPAQDLHGTFVATATLMSSNHAITRQARFDLP